MITDDFKQVYAKFKMHFYHEVFKKWRGRDLTLTTTETFCMEIIYMLGRPTVSEFAKFASLSSANAADKVNNLISKGYLLKTQCETDKRKYFLEPTEKYRDYYDINNSYIDTVLEKVEQRFPEEKLQVFREILEVMHEELMD